MSNMATTKAMWRKRALVPIWIIEILVTGIFFIIACVLLAWANGGADNDDIAGYSRSNLAASGAIIVAITGVTLLLTFIEIGLFAASKLKPTLHLVSAVVKAFIWVIYFLIVVIASAAAGGASPLDIILSLAVAISTIAQVIYGSIVVHRVRKGVFKNSPFDNNNGHGPVSYETENGYKMAEPVAEIPQYR